MLTQIQHVLDMDAIVRGRERQLGLLQTLELERHLAESEEGPDRPASSLNLSAREALREIDA